MNELIKYFVMGVRWFMAAAGFACAFGCAIAILYLVCGFIKGIVVQFKGGDDNEG